jgi:putative FmdB family regulatory protein
MPTYEFRCPQGHEFERFYRTISGAQAQVACPQCGQVAERKLSVAGLAFKGSGFYLTDYGKNAHRTSGAPESKPDAAPSADGATPASAKGGESSSGGAEGTKGAAKPAEAKPAAAPPAKKSSSE